MPNLINEFDNLNDWMKLLNGVAWLGSISIFGLFIGMITEERKKGNNKEVRNWSIAFGVSVALGVVISLADFDLIMKFERGSDYLFDGIKFLSILFSGVPYLLVSGLTSVTNKIVGEPKEPAFGLKELNKKYGGRLNQVLNLGKSDSSFIFMNTFKYSKRESILPCKTAGVKGVCQVRRSVIYMVFYLAALMLVPLFITLGDIKNNNNKFDRHEYLYWLTLFSFITIGLVIVFVLSTVKSMAGSEVFGNTDIKQDVEAI